MEVAKIEIHVKSHTNILCMADFFSDFSPALDFGHFS
jgi:hypothetical protein